MTHAETRLASLEAKLAATRLEIAELRLAVQLVGRACIDGVTAARQEILAGNERIEEALQRIDEWWMDAD